MYRLGDHNLEIEKGETLEAQRTNLSIHVGLREDRCSSIKTHIPSFQEKMIKSEDDALFLLFYINIISIQLFITVHGNKAKWIKTELKGEKEEREK